MQQIDWASLMATAEDAGRPPTAGRHRVRVEKADWKYASTGKPMIKLNLRITEGGDVNKTFFDQLVIAEDSPFALARFFNQVRAFGIDPAAFAALSPDQIASLFLGREVFVTVKTDREFKGTIQVDVEEYQPLGAGVTAPPIVPPPVPASPVTPGIPPAPVVTPPTVPATGGNASPPPPPPRPF